ncbi:MAG: hypothetical protein F2923_06730 [Actinobacteria bacterium]|uniref:Unannotated protein n=1 Tax=freshwater metagenome TaxID=449393 RepID=A0A6J7SM33_9ZZZZ|nr:hypothetical protein [Actinomycetota bacterium]
MNANYRATRTTSASQKILALGLASATCVGLVGMIAVRSAQDASAQEATSQDGSTQVDLAAVTTSNGVTQTQLDQYAAQLATERARLEAYRQQLVTAANQLSTQSSTAANVAKPKRVPKKPTAVKNKTTAAADSSSSATSTYAAPQAPAVQAPVQQQFVPAPQQQSNGWSNGGGSVAQAPAAKTRASKG